MAAANPAGAKLELKEVAFSYNKRGNVFQALSPITMDLERGGFTSVIGPSGCGKSTLMNMIAGFEQPTSGQILINGQSLDGPSPQVGMVFQQYGLFPWFSALGNVKFALKRFKLSREQMEKSAMAALEEVGLSEQAHKYPYELSGGMQQRVSLARSLVSEPSLLLMDEPFGALDAQTRGRMQQLLLQLWQKRGFSVFFITHDVDEALQLSEQIIVLSKSPGRILKTFDLSAIKRPRRLDEEHAELISMRAEIMSLLM